MVKELLTPFVNGADPEQGRSRPRCRVLRKVKLVCMNSVGASSVKLTITGISDCRF